jgi:hypothetical protein
MSTSSHQNLTCSSHDISNKIADLALYSNHSLHLPPRMNAVLKDEKYNNKFLDILS